MSVMTTSGAVLGVEGIPVRVEVDILRRLPAVQIVGLAASSVRESAERVRSAVVAQGLEWPRKRVVINLAPADLRKEGTAFDLPIAVAVLAAAGDVPVAALEGRVLAGELSLSGDLRPVRGALALALMARDDGCRELILPRACASEAAIVRGLQVRGAGNLGEVLEHLRGVVELPTPPVSLRERLRGHRDLSEVRGQLLARRAMEIAAAGGHNLLMIGPPGCGKTMPLGAPSTRHAASTVQGGLVGESDGEPWSEPWEGSCPECGGRAVYREVEPGQVVGACCSQERCWWSSNRISG